MMKVLVVDRRADLRSALILLLKEMIGLEAISEASGIAEIKEALRNNPPDLILIDWGILGKKGKNILASIRSYNPGVKIVAIDGNEETKQDAMVAGVDEFVTKEYSPDRLIAVLNQICTKQSRVDTSTFG